MAAAHFRSCHRGASATRIHPKAALAIAKRLADARKRELWRPMRNAVDDELAALIAEAEGLSEALA